MVSSSAPVGRRRAPIEKMPNELLAEIFGYCDSDWWEVSDFYSWKASDCESFPSHLLLVSRHWMDLAVNTPRLWTTFRFAFFDERCPILVSNWIQRSHPLPISFDALASEGDAENWDTMGVEYTKVYNEVVEALCKVSGRWKDVRFDDLPARFAERVIQAAREAHSCTNFDLSVSASAFEDTPLQLQLPDIPSVSIIWLTATVVATSTPLESTRVVRLDCLADADAFVHLLLSAPFLAELSLRFFAAGMEYQGDPILAKKLYSMALTFKFEPKQNLAIARSVFQTITAPFLTTLYLREDKTFFTQAVFIGEFLTRSRCPLQRFCYETQNLLYDLIIIADICKLVPTLKLLDIRVGADAVDFTEFLEEIGDTRHLPLLQTLCFQIIHTGTDFSSFIIPPLREFVEPRCRTSGGQLREVIVFRGTDINDYRRRKVEEREVATALCDLGVHFDFNNQPCFHYNWNSLP